MSFLHTKRLQDLSKFITQDLSEISPEDFISNSRKQILSNPLLHTHYHFYYSLLPKCIVILLLQHHLSGKAFMGHQQVH